jgi:hypothetical protein
MDDKEMSEELIRYVTCRNKLPKSMDNPMDDSDVGDCSYGEAGDHATDESWNEGVRAVWGVSGSTPVLTALSSDSASELPVAHQRQFHCLSRKRSSSGLPPFDLKGRELALVLPAHMPHLVISRQGAVVQNGTLKLPPSASIVVAAAGVTLRKLRVKGAPSPLPSTSGGCNRLEGFGWNWRSFGRCQALHACDVEILSRGTGDNRAGQDLGLLLRGLPMGALRCCASRYSPLLQHTGVRQAGVLCVVARHALLERVRVSDKWTEATWFDDAQTKPQRSCVAVSGGLNPMDLPCGEGASGVRVGCVCLWQATKCVERPGPTLL